MTEEQLLSHAARCARLAERCLDPLVAHKLLALARDYRTFARQATGRASGPVQEDIPLEPSQPRRLAVS